MVVDEENLESDDSTGETHIAEWDRVIQAVPGIEAALQT
jgi:hypothetical protein